MNLLSWFFFGLIVGVITHLIDSEDAQGGFGGTILLGILGAMIGGLIANVVFGMNIKGFDITSFSIAVLGALLLLWVQRAVKRTT